MLPLNFLCPSNSLQLLLHSHCVCIGNDCSLSISPITPITPHRVACRIMCEQVLRELEWLHTVDIQLVPNGLEESWSSELRAADLSSLGLPTPAVRALVLQRIMAAIKYLIPSGLLISLLHSISIFFLPGSFLTIGVARIFNTFSSLKNLSFLRKISKIEDLIQNFIFF